MFQRIIIYEINHHLHLIDLSMRTWLSLKYHGSAVKNRQILSFFSFFFLHNLILSIHCFHTSPLKMYRPCHFHVKAGRDGSYLLTSEIHFFSHLCYTVNIADAIIMSAC